MTEDVLAAAEPVLREIGVQIDLLDGEGGAYTRAYLTHHMTGARRPVTPLGMHPKIAQALRDMALDEAAALRLYGPGQPRPTQPRYRRSTAA